MQAIQCVIVGAGPAGLSAGIYTARAGMETQIFGCDPKIAGDYEIDNYFGFPQTISGKDLIDRGREQALRFGAKINCERVLAIHPEENGNFTVKTEKNSYLACTIILATGVSRIRSGISNDADYDGKGLSYCVSCDGFFYRNKPVLVVGQGIFAANQALELQTYTKDVAVVTQGEEITMTDEFRQNLADANIPLIEEKIIRLHGENGLEQVEFENGQRRDTHGLFVAMGEASSLDFAYSLGVERKGIFLAADDEQKTNVPGVFAAGDCLGGFLQISVAVGEGAKAARSANRHIRKNCKAGA